MNEPAPDSPAPPAPPTAPRSSWAKAATIVAVFALLIFAVLFVFEKCRRMPGAAVNSGVQIARELGAGAAKAARAFNQATVREEFVSRAAELEGTSYFQFATLKQTEIFKREESGSTAFGWVPLPRVVVQAQAPVEYSYRLDFGGDWRFERDGNTLTVFTPPITANTPALDVSALTFYTLEGSVWRDDTPVRERLRAGLTASLKKRAGENINFVREIGRRRLEEFVERWLAEKFTDVGDLRVKVIFPDERPLSAAEKKEM